MSAPSATVPAAPADQTGGFCAVSRATLSRDALVASSPEVEAITRRLRSAYTEYGQASSRDAALKDIPGARLSPQEAALLYHESDLFTLGSLAHACRTALHPEGMVTYVADRNINYSNICVCACRFCAFYRAPGHPEGYVLTREELGRKIEETLELGGTQILMQGGHHPDLPLSFYEDLIRWIRERYPSIHVHSFSPPEIVFFARNEGLSVDEVLHRLAAAGLHSIPGGGAEILVDAVRARVAPNKCTADEWLMVMEKAHHMGLKTTVTMMFGHEETDADRLEHLFRVREVQDRTGGFTAFIPWTFQPSHTNIDCPPETSQGYLRMLALSRLALDNIPNIQSSWVTMGPQVAQLALFFGANDFGSLMIEENVVASAGVSFRLSRKEIHDIINGAGFTPKQRAMDYSLIETVRP